MIVGIDPGISGGLCAMTHAGEIKAVRTMPTMKAGKKNVVDLAAVALFVKWAECELVIMEKVFTRPGDGRMGVLSYAEGAFKIQGLLFGVNVPCELVRPQDWMRDLGIKATKDEKGKVTKAENIALAKKMWPEQDWLATDRCSNPHTGMIDAALIAFYGTKR